MKQKNLNNLVKELNEYFEKIVENLFKTNNYNSGHFEDYLFLIKNFNNGNFNDDFKKKYVKFYLRGPRKFNQELKLKYFEILSKKTKNLEEILKNLKEIPPNYFWLSFVTKLIHTINKNLPIYDSNIAKELKLKARNGTIETDIEIYKELQNKYYDLFNQPEFRDILIKFRNVLKEKYIEEYKIISDTKIADSLIWELNNIKKKNE